MTPPPGTREDQPLDGWEDENDTGYDDDWDQPSWEELEGTSDESGEYPDELRSHDLDDELDGGYDRTLSMARRNDYDEQDAEEYLRHSDLASDHYLERRRHRRHRARRFDDPYEDRRYRSSRRFR